MVIAVLDPFQISEVLVLVVLNLLLNVKRFQIILPIMIATYQNQYYLILAHLEVNKNICNFIHEW